MGPVNLVSRPRRFKTALLLALSLVLVLAMKTGIAQEGGGGPLSVPDDWTSRHVIFSGARSEAAAEKLAYEPRYLHQWLKHNRPLRRGDRARESNGRFAAPVAGDQLAAPAVAETFPVPGLTSLYLAAERAAARRPQPKPQPAASGLKQDWASQLDAGATVGAGMYPAKFTFDVAAAPDCVNDYVVFNTGPGTGSVAASRTGDMAASGTPAAGGTVTIGGLVFTATASDNSGTNFAVSSISDSQRAANLAAAINRPGNGSSVGVSAASSNTDVIVTATTPGTAGNSITLSENLNGFTWPGGTLTGGVNATNPSIVAYNNLYSTQSATLQGLCGGSGPTVRWAYLTGQGWVVASPVLSLDGTKVIYVETKASGAVLHVLQLKSGGEGTVASPVTPTTVTAWGSCAAGASCVVNLPFNGSQQATKSAPFYDYATDTVYVGDDAGRLHKFTPVLSGTPAEVVTANVWPVTVHSGTGYVLNGPVLDSTTGSVFVTDSNGTNSYVCYVPVAGGTAGTCIAAALTGIISDPVIVDSSAGTVYAFSTVNGATVHRYNTALASPVTIRVSAGNETEDVQLMFSGAFDHTYLTSSDGTGKMYVCGKTGTTSTNTRGLYRINLTTGAMTSDGSLALTNNNYPGGNNAAQCSPVTEFYNASTGMDWVFLNVADDATTPTGTACNGANGGCVVSLNVTGTAWPPAAMTAGYVTPDGVAAQSTSGIVVDNAGGTTTVPVTSLSAAITAGAGSFTVAAATGFAVNDYIQIDAEKMYITGIAGNTLTVTRAQLSTTAAAHLINTAVVDLRTTLLNGAITNSATTITVDQNTTLNVGDYIQIDNEAMLITAKPTVTTLTVTRNRLGSAAAAHVNNSVVTDLSMYPQAASVYFSFALNSSAAVRCNGTTGVGCAVKLTQDGLR